MVQVEFAVCRSMVIIIVKTREKVTVDTISHHFTSGSLSGL